jgi:MFS family permease
MRQTLIANTVPREALNNAYATNVLTIPGTRMIGPFIGGIMIAALGFFWNFSLESLLYLGNVVMLLFLKTPYYARRKQTERTSIFADLKEGVVYVSKHNRVILLIILLSFIPNTFLQPVMFLLPIFTQEVLGHGADVGGFLLAVNGFGGLLAALFLASFGFVARRGKIILVTAFISSVFAIVFSQAYWLPVAFVVIGAFAASQTAFRTTSGALLQSLVPDELRARVTSLQRYSQGFVVVASLVVGWFAGITSVTIALIAIGLIGMALSGVFLIMAKNLRTLA